MICLQIPKLSTGISKLLLWHQYEDLALIVHQNLNQHICIKENMRKNTNKKKEEKEMEFSSQAWWGGEHMFQRRLYKSLLDGVSYSIVYNILPQ